MINNINKLINSGDRFLCQITKDPVYSAFKNSVNLVVQNLCLSLQKPGISVFDLKTYINNTYSVKFEERKNKYKNISTKIDKVDREFLDGKGGCLWDICKISLSDAGDRAEAIYLYTKIKTAQKKIDQLINDFSLYTKNFYIKELSLYTTQASKNDKIDILVLSEKELKDTLGEMADILFFYVSDIDKSIETIRNLNKSTELLLKV